MFEIFDLPQDKIDLGVDFDQNTVLILTHCFKILSQKVSQFNQLDRVPISKKISQILNH